MDKEWVRKTVESQDNAIYGLKNPSKADVEKMVDRYFTKCPAFQFMGYNQLNPLFGCYQGTDQLKEYYMNFYNAVEVLGFKKQFISVDGFGASAHYAAEFKFKESGSVYDFELVGLVDLDMDGRVRGLRFHFDSSTFLKAFNTRNGKFKDVQGIMPHPNINPNSNIYAAGVMSNTFMKLYRGEETWENFYSQWAEDAEIVFKSNVDLIPYAGQYSGKEGAKLWFKNLLSIWSLATFNFTNVYCEGNVADFAMDEQHYYTNPDGSKRYLSVYLVQSWIAAENEKIHRFR